MLVDWFKLIVDLETKGISLRHQSEAARVSPATVHYWKCGGEPKYSNGQMLIDLYTTQISTNVPFQSTLKSR